MPKKNEPEKYNGPDWEALATKTDYLADVEYSHEVAGVSFQVKKLPIYIPEWKAAFYGSFCAWVFSHGDWPTKFKRESCEQVQTFTDSLPSEYIIALKELHKIGIKLSVKTYKNPVKEIEDGGE